MANIFERGTKKKLRFKTDSGVLGIEDLWDLPLEGLDKIAQDLAEKVDKEGKSKSFIEKSRPVSTETKLSFEIVKRIIAVRLAEAEAVEKRKETIARKQKIMEIMARKKDESLEGMDMDELQGLLDDLGG